MFYYVIGKRLFLNTRNIFSMVRCVFYKSFWGTRLIEDTVGFYFLF